MKTNSFTPPATGGYCIPWLPVALLHRRPTAASVALPEPQDGGRDALSPGVPLYLGTLSRPRKTRAACHTTPSICIPNQAAKYLGKKSRLLRSEERRVGKECRSRW